jgi:hypothetical protein
LQVASKLINRTELPVSKEPIEAALSDFTEKTGIPTVVVIEDMEEVFPKRIGGSAIGLVIVSVIVVVVVVAMVRSRKKPQEKEWE